MNKLNQIIFLLLLLLPLLSNAQGWEKTYDAGYDERIYAADNTLDGGVIMAGIQTDNLNDIEYPSLYKTDADGNLQWEFYDTLFSATAINLANVLSTSDGNYLLSALYGSTFPLSEAIVRKINSTGDMLWSHDLATFLLDYTIAMAETNDEEYVLVGTYESPQRSAGVVKLDAFGNMLWEKGFEMTDNPMFVRGVTIATNGDILISGYFGFIGNQDAFVKRLDSNTGDVIWEKEYDNSVNDFALEMVELSNGDFVVSGTSSEAASGQITRVPTLLKINADGNQIWYQALNTLLDREVTGFKETIDGGFVITGFYDPSTTPNGAFDIFMIKTDADGNEVWTRTYGRSLQDFSADVLLSSDGGFYIPGYTLQQDITFDAYLIKTDSEGYSFTNELSGNIFHDENLDCSLDGSENGLQQWLIEVEKGDAHYMTLSDSQGNYEFNLDTGNYEMSIYPVSPYWELCDTTFAINLATTSDTITQNVGAQVLYDCPLLDVSIGSPFLRRCFENYYTVQYCNYGTTVAEDAYVVVTIDPFMIVTNTSISPTSVAGTDYTFDLGDIEVGECGSFTLDLLLGDSTNCDSIPLGATHCVEAHIYPDSICTPSGNWSGASVEVDAICTGDSISFFITNVGTAATQSNLTYIVVEDNVVLFSGDFGLDPNESEVVTVATNGSTFRMEAEQEPNHPGMSMPSVSVENCGDPNSVFTFGFVNDFAQDDGNPFVDIDCQQNIGAFDPNDKRGFPLGYGDENYINRGQDIEYVIRFQNTGTDTAFNVVIKDELSELLDVTSVRPGASSHPYQFDISGNGILSFTFDNIMLPDSNINEPASHGFVKFKVAQQPDLELETKIHNSAAIYFDFNAPIITNQTLHTIGENLIMVSIDPVEPLAEVKIYPNPFSEFVNIEIEDLRIDDGQFKLFDATGKLLRQQNFNQSNFRFHKKNLRTGMYFFTIENNGQLISSGKMIVKE